MNVYIVLIFIATNVYAMLICWVLSYNNNNDFVCEIRKVKENMKRTYWPLLFFIHLLCDGVKRSLANRFSDGLVYYKLKTSGELTLQLNCFKIPSGKLKLWSDNEVVWGDLLFYAYSAFYCICRSLSHHDRKLHFIYYLIDDQGQLIKKGF